MLGVLHLSTCSALLPKVSALSKRPSEPRSCLSRLFQRRISPRTSSNRRACTDAMTFNELLPMPRPFNAPKGRVPRSSRRRARWAATHAAMTLANHAAAAGSWLAYGSPTGALARVSVSWLSALRLSGAQPEAAAGFLARARSFACRGSLTSGYKDV